MRRRSARRSRSGLLRDGKPLEVEITIAEMKDEGSATSKKPEVEKDFFGLVVQNITPDIAKHLNLKDKRGVIVTDVQPGSPAQNADIRSGDVIKEIGRKPIKNLSDFKEVMKKSNIKEGVVLLITRENATFYAVIRE